LDASLSLDRDIAVVDFDFRSSWTIPAFVVSAFAVSFSFLTDVLIFKIGAVLVYLLVPFAIFEAVRLRPKLRGRWEVDRKRRKVKRVTSAGNCEEKRIGEFEEIEVVHAYPPLRGTHVFFVLLKCSEGAILLAGSFSKERAVQLGRSLADWLAIKISDSRYESVIAFNAQEFLFSRPSAWTS